MEPVPIDNADYFSDYFAIIGRRLLDILSEGHKKGYLSLGNTAWKKNMVSRFFS